MKSTFPYYNLQTIQVWNKAENWHEFINPINPHRDSIPKFEIDSRMSIASAGSCFAQRISQSLKSQDFNYLVTEKAPKLLSKELASDFNYGIYTARFGNIYTVRQLLQLLERASNTFGVENQAWLTKDKFFIDKFRPRIQPNGFESVSELLDDSRRHLIKVLEMFTTAEIFIFTLGLTESWVDLQDGSVLPACPGRGFGEFDKDIHKFKNFTHNEIMSDMRLFIEKITVINPQIKIILTVSPVPMAATIENQHILLSSTYSKATLRSVATEICQIYSNVEYFGSFEILKASARDHIYWESDFREVNSTGLNAVFASFYSYFCSAITNKDLTSRPCTESLDTVFTGIECDEVQLLEDISKDL